MKQITKTQSLMAKTKTRLVSRLVIFAFVIGGAGQQVLASPGSTDELATATSADPRPQERATERARVGAVGESSGVFHMGTSGCNAWVVDGNHIVTNNHCVANGGVKLVFYREGRKIEITNCQTRPVTRSAKLDYALFKCAGIGEKIPPVRIADREPTLNEKFTLVTHDLQNPSRQRRAEGKIGAPFTIASTGGTGFEARGATVISGNSGSVVYDKNGNALGLVWGADTTNAKSAAITSLKDLVADIKSKTTEVAFNLTSDPNRQVADATPVRPTEPIAQSPSAEPETRPGRSAEQPVVNVQPQPRTEAQNDPVPETYAQNNPPSSLAMAPAAANAEESSFQKNLPMIALAGAAIVGGILIYKIIQDNNRTDRKLAEIQAQMWAQQNAAATKTTTATTTTPDPTPVVAAPMGAVNTSLKHHDFLPTAHKFNISGVKIVPAMVKQLQPVKMPYLPTDYVTQRPTEKTNSRKLAKEAL